MVTAGRSHFAFTRVGDSTAFLLDGIESFRRSTGELCLGRVNVKISARAYA